MLRQVALLRALNVGGRNRLRMDALRELFASLGLIDVKSYLQSGNVIYSCAKVVRSDELELAIEREFAISTSVMVRTHDELEKIVLENPFRGRDPSTLHVGFMANLRSAPALEVPELASEEFCVRGRDVFISEPDGMARAKLPSYLERRLDTQITFRSMKTVAALEALVRGSEVSG